MKLELQKIQLLENNVAMDFDSVQCSSATSETLDESENYRNVSVTHISDDTYRFFLAVERQRVDTMNLHKFKNDQIDISLRDIIENKVIQDEFVKLFKRESDGNNVRITLCVFSLHGYVSMFTYT